MAENPIRKEDIIDEGKISQAIKEIVDLLQTELINAMKGTSKEAAELRASLTQVNTATKAGQVQTKAAAERTQELSATKKQLLKLEAELEKATTQYNVLRSTEGKILSEQIRRTKEATKAMQDNRKELQHAEGSYNALNKRLNDLVKQYKATTEAQRKGLTPEIQKLNKELKKLDADMGMHQRNVGNYTDAMTALPGPLGRAASGAKQLGVALKGLLLNPVVLAVTAIVGAFAALGAAFKSTDKGGTELAARFEQIKAIIDVFRQRLIAVTDAIGNIFKGNWREAAEDMKTAFMGQAEQLKNATNAAYEYQYALDAIKDSESNYISQSAENRNKIAKLEYSAQDRTKSTEERRKALEEAITLEEEETRERQRIAKEKLDIEANYLAGKAGLRGEDVIGFIRMTDAEQENASKSLKRLRNNNEDKFDEIEKLYAAWIDADTKFYEENKRNISRMTGFEETVRKENEEKEKEVNEKRLERLKKLQEEEESLRKIGEERVKKYWDNQTQIAEKATEDNKAIIWKGYDDEYKLQLAQVDKQVATEEEKEKRISEIRKKDSALRIQNAIKESGEILKIVSDGLNSIGQIYEAQKQRELSAAGDNAKKREEIERKYFQKQKALSIANTLVNGAVAVTRQFADLPFVAALITSALITASTIAQVSMIASQKFAKGGFTGKGGQRDETGERVAGIVHENEFVIDKKKTKKYRPLLDAIHRDDSLAVAAELNNSKLVWARTADFINHQDPYTEKMYQLMKDTPVPYVDSNGSTVLVYPGGRKRVIKRPQSIHYSPSMIR